MRLHSADLDLDTVGLNHVRHHNRFAVLRASVGVANCLLPFVSEKRGIKQKFQKLSNSPDAPFSYKGLRSLCV
jgi:hypothetical protein